ncbi:MAG: Nramp family divalent metal transporter [Pirellulales bacterium]
MPPLPPLQPARRSLDEVHRTVGIPTTQWWRRMLAFVGPAYMVSVGYMDPGNWATDLEGGARLGYQLIWILLLSNLMAVLLQTLSARLGLVTGHDLAQACRDDYPRAVRYVLYGLCEIAIAATDLAEVLGSAIGLNLLLGIPMLWAVGITGTDVFLLLFIQRLGIRKMEGFIVGLIAMIGLCFVVELFLAKPVWSEVASGFVPRPLSGSALYIAIGIIGATVMPHNLYLHSALVQSRDVTRSRQAVAQACKYNLIDSIVALNLAFFVNAAIMIVAAATFFANKIPVTQLQQAHALLYDVLGSQIAPIAFALALICAGQSSTVTGTLAGQITMEGFLNFRMRPWLRRLLTRALAIVPAMAVIAAAGDGGTYRLLILSQVVLSMQLPFAVVPLVKFTASTQKMGPFANRRWVNILAWTVTAFIVVLNTKLIYEQVSQWIEAAGSYGWLVGTATIPIALALGGLLAWMTLKRDRPPREAAAVSAAEVASQAAGLQKRFRRIGVALEAQPSDAAMLAEAISLARLHQAELVLLHVVEGVGGQWYGPQTGDRESRQDEDYLLALAEHVGKEAAGSGVEGVRAALGFGDVQRELVRLATEEKLDLLVLGTHGHRGLSDLFHGQTLDGVRHGLSVPILAVR